MTCALRGGCERVLGNILSSLGSGKQWLHRVSPDTTALIWGCIDGSLGNVGTRIWARNGFGLKRQWCGKFGRVHREPWKVQNGIWAYAYRHEADCPRKEEKKHGPATRVASEKGSLVSHQQEICQCGLDVRGADHHDTQRNPSRATKLGAAVPSGVRIGKLANRQTTRNFRGELNVIR